MNERILNLLSLCMQAKEKGHDCFFDYSPHVQCVSICVYRNGWKEGEVVDDIVVRDFTDRKFGFYIEGDTREVNTIIDMAEDYIKGLI